MPWACRRSRPNGRCRPGIRSPTPTAKRSPRGRPSRRNRASPRGRRSCASCRSARSLAPCGMPSERIPSCATSGSRVRWGASPCLAAGHAYFTLKDERSQLSCVFFRDERVALAFRAADRTACRRPRTGRRLRVPGCLPAVRDGVQPAGFGDLALRFEALKARLAAEGLFETARKTAAAGPTGGHRRGHQRHRRRLARHLPRRGPALAAGSADPLAVPGSGRGRGRRAWWRPWTAWRAGASCAWPRAGPRTLRRWSSWLVAAARWRICGRSTTNKWCGRSWRTLCRWCAAWGTKSTSRWPTSRRTSGRQLPPRQPNWWFRTGRRWRPPWPGLSRRAGSCVSGVVAAAQSGVAAEGRALERLQPSAQLAQARERAGYLLDRATQALRARGRAALGGGARSRRAVGAGGVDAPGWAPHGPGAGHGDRWRRWGRRRRWTAATPSCGGARTARSSGIRPRRRRGEHLGITLAAGELAATRGLGREWQSVTLVALAVMVALAVAAFAASIRIGMLLGLRLDRVLEERASRESGAGEEVGSDD